MGSVDRGAALVLTVGLGPGKLPAVARVLDVFAILLLLSAACAFTLGIRALGDHDDFKAIYLLVVGGLALRASTELLRPRGGTA